MSAQSTQTGFTAFSHFLLRVSVVFIGMLVLPVFLVNRIEEMPTETERCAERLAELSVRMKGLSPLESIQAMKRAEIRALAICSGSTRG